MDDGEENVWKVSAHHKLKFSSVCSIIGLLISLSIFHLNCLVHEGIKPWFISRWQPRASFTHGWSFNRCLDHGGHTADLLLGSRIWSEDVGHWEWDQRACSSSPIFCFISASSLSCYEQLSFTQTHSPCLLYIYYCWTWAEISETMIQINHMPFKLWLSNILSLRNVK